MKKIYTNVCNIMYTKLGNIIYTKVSNMIYTHRQKLSNSKLVLNIKKNVTYQNIEN